MVSVVKLVKPKLYCFAKTMKNIIGENPFFNRITLSISGNVTLIPSWFAYTDFKSISVYVENRYFCSM